MLQPQKSYVVVLVRVCGVVILVGDDPLNGDVLGGAAAVFRDAVHGARCVPLAETDLGSAEEKKAMNTM